MMPRSPYVSLCVYRNRTNTIQYCSYTHYEFNNNQATAIKQRGYRVTFTPLFFYIHCYKNLVAPKQKYFGRNTHATKMNLVEKTLSKTKTKTHLAARHQIDPSLYKNLIGSYKIDNYPI